LRTSTTDIATFSSQAKQDADTPPTPDEHVDLHSDRDFHDHSYCN
jgi:hypothetical protein